MTVPSERIIRYWIDQGSPVRPVRCHGSRDGVSVVGMHHLEPDSALGANRSIG